MLKLQSRALLDLDGLTTDVHVTHDMRLAGRSRLGLAGYKLAGRLRVTRRLTLFAA